MKKLLVVPFALILLGFGAPSALAASCTSGYVLSPNDLQTYNADGTPCDVVESSGAPSNADSGSFGGTGVNYRVDATGQTSGTQTAANGQTAGSNKFVPIAPIPNLTQGITADQSGLARFLNNLYIFLVGLAAVIAIVEIIWGGLEIATKDSVPMHMKGKERIQQALLGLLLVLSPVLVFSIINPRILNLSANIPPLDIHKGTATGIKAGPSTVPTQISQTDVQIKAGNGVTVLYAVNVSGDPSARQVASLLDAEQTKCTNYQGGPGIIVENMPLGGGMVQYVCQTCPAGQTPQINARWSIGGHSHGSCVAATQSTAAAASAAVKEDYYATPPAGAYCLAIIDSAVKNNQPYYCAPTSDICAKAAKDFAGSVKTACQQY